MRREQSSLRRESPGDPASLDQAVQRLATTARLAGLSVAGGLLDALHTALLAQGLQPARED